MLSIHELFESVNPDSELNEGIEALSGLDFSGDKKSGFHKEYGKIKVRAFEQAGLPVIEVTHEDQGFFIDGKKGVDTFVKKFKEVVIKDGNKADFDSLHAKFSKIITDEWL